MSFANSFRWERRIGCKLNLNVKVKDNAQVLAECNSKVMRLNSSVLSHLNV